jgi:hypothetical protein
MQTPLTYSYHLVVAHPREPLALLPAGAESLPGFSLPERRFWQEVDHINREARALLQTEVSTLRCLAIDYERERELLTRFYAVAPLDAGWEPPPGARWVGPAELGGLPERQRQVLAEWFDWLRRPAPPARAPWYRPGWLAEASAWARDALSEAGLTLSGPVEQLRSWQRSAILRLPTPAGPAYLKAVPPMFGHEPALTAALAAADPGRFTRPLALNQGRGWLLMRELRGPGLHELREVERWEAALRSFAEVQIASVGRAAELRALGVPERRLEDLAQRAGPLLADVPATLPGDPAGLSDAQRAQLAQLGPRLRDWCAELAAYRIPPALEHGDFWAGQVVVADRGYGFLDWSDSSIAHPFFSLLLFLIEVDDYFPKEPGVRERLRDAYLAPWAALAPRHSIVRAFELAQPLAALHHAISYHQVVLPNMELRWEMELMLPFYLKMLLRLAG